MLQRLSAAALLASLLVLPAKAGAEPVAVATPPAVEPPVARPPAVEPPVARPPVATPPSASKVRRDPLGIKGISPYSEAIKRGDTALFAGDIPAALFAYRDAVGIEPDWPLAFYRLGEAHILNGDLEGAERAIRMGLPSAAANPSLKAKMQFALADLREQQKAYDDASAEWTAYEALATTQKEAQGFPASGSERKRAVLAWKKLLAESQEVRARIEKGVRAADEAVKKSSK